MFQIRLLPDLYFCRKQAQLLPDIFNWDRIYGYILTLQPHHHSLKMTKLDTT